MRRRTLPPNLPLSIRHPGDYENTETQTPTQALQWIPASVIASDGRNDKIHVTCDIATVICDDIDDARSFVFYCGAPPKDQRDQHELYSKLFNTASKNGDGNTLEIRCQAMTCGKQNFQAASFTGKLRFRRLKRQDGKTLVLVKADLCLNINRALNHQRAALANNSRGAIFKSPALLDLGLCGNDNIAPFDIKGDEHDNARRVYFDLMASAIFADVKRAAEIAGGSGGGYLAVDGNPRDFSLQAVETCWDIGGAGFDAMKALSDLTPALSEHGGKRGWEGNAGTMTVEFSKWERLVVYAKASDRLRFEIRHRPPQGNRPYSSPTVAETLGKLDDFRELATDKANDFLLFLKSRRAISRTESEWEAYAMSWGACFRNSEASRKIYQILRKNGRILGGKYSQCIEGGEKLLRKARDAGLVENRHGAFRPIFPSIPELALTHLDNSGELLGHNTETHPVGTVPNFPAPIRKRSGQVAIPPCPPLLLDRG